MNRFAKLALVSFFFFLGSPSIGQVTSSTNTNSGSKNTFNFTIQSTYGVSTSANASPNFKVENEAILKLKSGSFVTNRFGNEDDSVSATFIATPTGANVNLEGIAAKNLLLIDDGTYFKSTLKSVDNPDPTLPMQATASATATHTSTIYIEKGESSFTQSLTSNF